MIWVWLVLCISPACSLAPPPDPTPPGRLAERTVLRRVSAVVVTSDKNLHEWVVGGFEPMQEPQHDIDGGSATPISPDGYFLTADHVLANSEGRQIYILYGGGGPLISHLARVVWRSAAADLALLHIAAETPMYYQFTAPHRWLPAGTPVMHGGIATGLESEPGKMESSLRPENRFTRARKFKIDIPLRPGDSGGPVVDARGDLVGVNSAVEFLVPMETAFFVDSEASRPNVRDIRWRMDRDRAQRSAR